MSALIDIITSTDPGLRDRALDDVCAPLDAAALLAECAQLDAFRRACGNLYESVRALLFLHAIHRYHVLPRCEADGAVNHGIPYAGYEHLLARRFEQAVDAFLVHQARHGASAAISSALADAYRRLAFQTLADQVRRSVRSARGNEWMFSIARADDHPLRIAAGLQPAAGAPAPILRERTPVRMDLSHSAWSDIFFLGMDFPEGARVLNVSIDLGVHGRDAQPRPPVEVYVRVIDEPLLRLSSADLGATADVSELAAVFDFARDYLGLLKAAVIASGVVPPGLEGSTARLSDVLARVCGPGRGLEIVSSVNGIPKGSRLAVSTTLLGALIAACMRATGQTVALTGTLTEDERRLVAARAILGEWLGGSGGGWQDSGGLWPGLKRIEGVLAAAGDPEYGVSRGRLLPQHTILDGGRAGDGQSVVEQLQASLVLVHGGMAQNVGPILEMVTEKYLLRCQPEWSARGQAMRIYDDVTRALQGGMGVARALGALTTRNFREPITTIIPAATNAYTERLIARAGEVLGSDLWGFWMLGGMSGGGMGFIVAPERRERAKAELAGIMGAAKRAVEHALPFAMEPVVYDFAVNADGTTADLHTGDAALMPPGYYALIAPAMARRDRNHLPALRRADLAQFARAAREHAAYRGVPQALFDQLFPAPAREQREGGATLEAILSAHGFDRAQHERVQADMRSGKVGLAQNRLPASTHIEDVHAGDVLDATRGLPAELGDLGARALRNGEAAVLSLAAGAGSRWTQGAGVVKALHPFVRLAGRHRSFLEIHLAKTRLAREHFAAAIPHMVSTSYLTHDPIAAWLGAAQFSDVWLSPGRSVGLRMIPMARDLRFAYEEVPQQRLDEQAQKMRDNAQAALIQWARAAGEGSDYVDNLPLQCAQPVGHWYEFPNLLRNGVLARVLQRQPQLKHIMLHNIDTAGADLDPAILGAHAHSGAALTFEVVERHLEDRGGGLARVDGALRMVEGLAMPHEEDEFKLRYYSSNTTWIDIDRLLAAFGLTRDDLGDAERVNEAVAALASRMPTYITLKDVKKRWGHGQEDVFPVAQFERLWGDLTALPGLACGYVAVPRVRGQQLKDIAQLDGWLRDGSARHVAQLCGWSSDGSA